MSEKWKVWFYIVYSKFAIVIIAYIFWIIQHVRIFYPVTFDPGLFYTFEKIFPLRETTKQDSNRSFTANWRTNWNGKEEEVRSVYAPNVERLIEVDVSCSDRRKVDVIVIVINVIVTVIISITDIRHRPIEFHSEI